MIRGLGTVPKGGSRSEFRRAQFGRGREARTPPSCEEEGAEDIRELRSVVLGNLERPSWPAIYEISRGREKEKGGHPLTPE